MPGNIFTLSGLRGVVGNDLQPEIICRVAAGFGTLLRHNRPDNHLPVVALGRDCRSSGAMLHAAALSGLLSTGCDVLDAGICPTPTIPLTVVRKKLAGGLMITASHNPPEWNGLKFISAAGAFLDQTQFQQLKRIIRCGHFDRAGWNQLGTHRYLNNALDLHIRQILSARYFRRVHFRQLRVGIDACNGAASVAAVRLIRQLGGKAFPLFCDTNARTGFPRKPEPTAEHLSELAQFVRDRRLDFGAAFDPDGDRFSCVDETGKPLGEEATVMLAIDFVLRQSPGPVVVNLSTTHGVDDIAARYGIPVYRTPVGEAAVVSEMQRVRAVVGGEGNGGVIIPAINRTRDGLVALTVVCGLLSQSGRRLSELAQELPSYYQRKDKLRTEQRWPTIRAALERDFAGARFIRQDGLKIILNDGWLHIRQSNTEPIVRIVAEATSAQLAVWMVRKAKATIRKRKE